MNLRNKGLFQSFLSTLYSVLQVCILLYFVYGALFYFLSDSVLYQPPRPTLFHDTEKTIKIPIKNDISISAVYLPHPQAEYTILFSHGNAEDLGYLLPYLQLYRQHGFSVFAYDYQGYGTSLGVPSEKNTYQDIMAAYQYLTKTLNVAPDKIILLGRSLGAGPSLYLAKREPVKALILESAFVSAYRVKTIWPIYPFDKYPNLQLAKETKVPTLIIHGTHDSIIPLWHGQKLFAALPGKKAAFWVDNADHNNVLEVAQNAYWQKISDFINSLSK
jgi:fermentation-respiration switch protein FrsA (DUF1100 family)